MSRISGALGGLGHIGFIGRIGFIGIIGLIGFRLPSLSRIAGAVGGFRPWGRRLSAQKTPKPLLWPYPKGPCIQIDILWS